MIFNLTDHFRLIFPSFYSSYLDFGLIFIIILTLIITLILAYRRLAFSRRFFGVCALNVLACFALIGLISDLQQQTQMNQKAIILTFGTSQNQVDSLFDTKFAPIFDKTLKNENTKVFILSKEQQWQDSLDLTRLKNTLIIDNVAAIYSHQPSVTHVSVYGDGLLHQQWQILENINANHINSIDTIDSIINIEEATKLNVYFYPSEVRTGPIKLNWPKQLIVGQPFTLSGQFVSATKDKARIAKISLSDMYDELMAEMYVKDQEEFNLSAMVKNKGRFTYQLKILDDNQQLIVTEPVAFTVSSSEKLKVAIKQSSASFESKYLKNWLAEQGEEVLVITKISKDKYIQQHINANTSSNAIANTNNLQNDKANITENDYAKLSTTWLSEFDLLYLDSRAFFTLDENEFNQLDTAVKQGLGLIIIVNDVQSGSITSFDGNKPANSLLRNLVSKNISQQKYSTSTQVLNTVPRWPHSQNERAIAYENIMLPKLSMSSILPMAKAIIQGSDGQALLVNHTYGLGNIAFSLVASSHQWSISGEKNTYSHYWQTIIEQVSRHNHSLAWLNAAENIIYFKGQAQTLCAQSTANEQTNVKANQLNLISTATAESIYCGKYWANNIGWQSLSLLEESTEEIQTKSSSKTQFSFVYSHENWLTWQQHIMQQASLANANNRKQTISELRYVSINKAYFWWLFFVTSSLLWLERKIR